MFLAVVDGFGACKEVMPVGRILAHLAGLARNVLAVFLDYLERNLTFETRYFPLALLLLKLKPSVVLFF